MSKKIISAVLALVFVMSLFTVSAFAVGDTAVEKEGSTYEQEWSLSQPENNGANGEYKVYVTLKADYTVGAIQFVAAPEKGKATLTGVELNSAVFTTAYNAQVSYNAVTGKVLIIPKPTSPSADGIDNLGDGKVIATLTYELEEGATSSKIEILNQPKTAKDPDGTLIAARLHEGTLTTATMYYGQNVTVGDSITIGAAAAEAPALVPVEGSLGVVDTTRTAIALDEDAEPIEGGVDGYLYGIQPDSDDYATIEDVFTIKGEGTMEVDGVGTGAMVYVKDIDGNVVATYVVIIFGDVNGDGDAEGTDMSFIDYHSAWMLTEDMGINDTENGRLLPHYAFAGDVNVDGDADGTDMSYIDYHSSWMLEADGLSNEDLRFDIAAIISML